MDSSWKTTVINSNSQDKSGHWDNRSISYKIDRFIVLNKKQQPKSLWVAQVK
jgi:hypothetical protein